METWVPVLVAVVTLSGTLIAAVLTNSAAKHQIDALTAIRLAQTGSLDSITADRLLLAERNLAARIELRYRPQSKAQRFGLVATFVFLLISVAASFSAVAVTLFMPDWGGAVPYLIWIGIASGALGTGVSIWLANSQAKETAAMDKKR